jgi:hypothetical membrane protein
MADGVRLLGLAGAIGPVIFVTLVIIAGAIEDGYSHISQKISELGGVTAEYSWIQDLNFFILSLSAIALAFAVHRAVGNGRGALIGPVLIAVFGFSAAGLNGVFPCDASCEGVTAAGKLHLITGVTGFLSMLIGLVLVSRRMARTPDWKTYSRYTLATAGVGFIALIGFIASDAIEGSTVAGLFQRVFVAPVLLWMLITGNRIFRARSTDTRAE